MEKQKSKPFIWLGFFTSVSEEYMQHRKVISFGIIFFGYCFMIDTLGDTKLFKSNEF